MHLRLPQRADNGVGGKASGGGGGGGGPCVATVAACSSYAAASAMVGGSVCNGSIAGDRLEVMSSGSRPSTSDSDASARGLNLKQAARAQKLNKLSGLYGGSAGGGLSCRNCAYACSSNVSARGNSAPGVGAGSGLGARDAMNGPRDASSARDRRSAGGGSAGPASGRHHMPPNVNMLRIPTELRSSSENERAFRRGGGGGSERGSTRDEDGRVGGMVSPLPFESSLAPDFLALFANNWTPGMD